MARRCSTICLPVCKDAYPGFIDSAVAFRGWLDSAFRDAPELFPQGFAQGYTLKDSRFSAKRGLRLRRIHCKATGQTFSVRPCFALPYMTGWADDVQGPLFLRGFGVPFWALARVFGRGPMYWYRLELSLGRPSIVGTTVRRAELPEHLLADEHHQPRDGVKNYIATTVAEGCCLGAALAPSAGADDLRAAYQVFKQEAQDVRPDYRPKTVNTDGWKPTRQAWLELFPLVVILRCFLHGWLNIRSRGKLSAAFATLSEKVWQAYRAPDRRSFAQRLRRLGEWAKAQVKTGWVLEQVQKLCGRAGEYGKAYRHPGGRHCRAWALLHNFRPWGPEGVRDNGGWRSPAERLNRHRYHDDWLQNLLVSASLGGYRR